MSGGAEYPSPRPEARKPELEYNQQGRLPGRFPNLQSCRARSGHVRRKARRKVLFGNGVAGGETCAGAVRFDSGWSSSYVDGCPAVGPVRMGLGLCLGILLFFVARCNGFRLAGGLILGQVEFFLNFTLTAG